MRDAQRGLLRPATPPFFGLSGAWGPGLAELTCVQGRRCGGDYVTYRARGSPGGWVERGRRVEGTVEKVGRRGVVPGGGC